MPRPFGMAGAIPGGYDPTKADDLKDAKEYIDNVPENKRKQVIGSIIAGSAAGTGGAFLGGFLKEKLMPKGILSGPYLLPSELRELIAKHPHRMAAARMAPKVVPAVTGLAGMLLAYHLLRNKDQGKKPEPVL